MNLSLNICSLFFLLAISARLFALDLYDIPQKVLASNGQTYTIEEKRGEGGFAIVYRATDSNGRPVAIKVFHDHLKSTQVEQALKGPRLISTVSKRKGSHILPAVVTQLVNAARPGSRGNTAIISPWMDFSLEELKTRFLLRGPLDKQELLRRVSLLDNLIFPGMVSSLQHLQAQGAHLLHRDIKPANFLVNIREGQIEELALTDFDTVESTIDPNAATTPKGTPIYMAPEVSKAKTVGEILYSDWYSLAMTALDLIAGKNIYDYISTEAGAPSLSKMSLMTLEGRKELLRKAGQDLGSIYQRMLETKGLQPYEKQYIKVSMERWIFKILDGLNPDPTERRRALGAKFTDFSPFTCKFQIEGFR